MLIAHAWNMCLCVSRVFLVCVGEMECAGREESVLSHLSAHVSLEQPRPHPPENMRSH